MRIVMVGSGYVGLVSGACFSEFGIEVACVDKDEAKIERLRRRRRSDRRGRRRAGSACRRR